MQRPAALVVDRDPNLRAQVARWLEEQGFAVASSDRVAGATSSAPASHAILALIEIDGGDPSIPEWIGRRRHSALIVGLAAAPSHDDPGSGIGASGIDVLRKPVDHDAIVRLAREALEAAGSGARRAARAAGERLVGESPIMRGVRSQLTSLARTSEPVWIVGEPGTGRRAAAERLHGASSRGDAPFVGAECADSRDVERLLSDDGRLQRVAGGTLYLADLAEMRLDRQDDLLHALERLGVGLSSPSGAATRIVIGTRTDPARAAEEGRLLVDLRRRLAGPTLQLPPLRERREDISALAESFVAEICEMNHLPPIRIAASALSVLEEYSWPRNLDELRGVIEQAVIVSTDELIRPRDLPEAIRAGEARRETTTVPAGISARPFREAKREVVNAFEKAYLSELLERHTGNVTAAAQHAGMLRSALQRLLRKYRLKSADFRGSRRLGRGPSSGKPADDAR